MLEIFAIIFLSKKNGTLAKSKGHSFGTYVFITIALWVGGEVLGGIIGAIATKGFGVYLFAIIGAVLGGVISYQIAKNLQNRNDNQSPNTSYNNLNNAAKPVQVSSYQPVQEIKSYLASGICDVCNTVVGLKDGYIIPVDMFYNSAKYKEWIKSNPLTEMAVRSAGGIDSYISNMRAMDSTSNSVVCKDCVNLFKKNESPVKAKINNCKAYASGRCIDPRSGRDTGPCSWNPQNWSSCGVVTENIKYYGSW